LQSKKLSYVDSNSHQKTKKFPLFLSIRDTNTPESFFDRYYNFPWSFYRYHHSKQYGEGNFKHIALFDRENNVMTVMEITNCNEWEIIWGKTHTTEERKIRVKYFIHFLKWGLRRICFGWIWKIQRKKKEGRS